MTESPPTPILQRAWGAYLASDGTDAEQPVLALCGEIEIAGLRYVYLRSETATLAVYRLKNSGTLRRMRQPPLQLVGGEAAPAQAPTTQSTLEPAAI
jgi:hypothetical protein